jgi:hypothetical protein
MLRGDSDVDAKASAAMVIGVPYRTVIPLRTTLGAVVPFRSMTANVAFRHATIRWCWLGIMHATLADMGTLKMRSGLASRAVNASVLSVPSDSSTAAGWPAMTPVYMDIHVNHRNLEQHMYRDTPLRYRILHHDTPSSSSSQVRIHDHLVT